MSDMIAKIDEFIVKMIQLAVRDVLDDESISVFKRDDYNEAGMMILYQFYYNEKSGNIFIEYNYNQNFLKNFDETIISDRIERFINANIKKDVFDRIADTKYVGVSPWSKIQYLSSHDLNCPAGTLTPATIGYWDSLIHKKVFLNDKIQMGVNMMSFINKLPAAYKEEVHNIFDMYYMTDFNTFSKKYCEALLSNHIQLDSEFVNELTEYVNDVTTLAAEYHVHGLPEDQAVQYMADYRQLYHDYHTDMVIFEQKVHELNESYGTIEDMNSLVPELFDKYRQIVRNYFLVELEDINDQKVDGYVEVYLVK